MTCTSGPAGAFRQGAHDRKRYVVEYGDWMDTGELLSAVVMASSAPEFIIDGYLISTDGLNVIFFASGGTSGSTYNASVTITTTQSQVKQDTIVFRII